MSKSQRIYFSGDGGYSDVFKKIGSKFGPFDLTIMENGAYDESWAKEHLMPEETVKAHLDLKGKYLMPVHNGTFDLAFHPWYEPLNEVSRIAKLKGVPLVTPVFGQPFTLNIDENKNVLASKGNWWPESRPLNTIQ